MKKICGGCSKVKTDCNCGRPTKYTDDLLKLAEEYVDSYESYGHAFPSIIGLADVINIRTSTVYDWDGQEGKSRFSDILDRIRRKQELVAWQKGLMGEYNANLVKLLLGKHGYGDKSEVDHTSKGEAITALPQEDKEILKRFIETQTEK